MEIEEKIISNENEFIVCIHNAPNDYVKKLHDVKLQETGVIVENLTFNYFPNHLATNDKKFLLSERIINALSGFVFDTDNGAKITFISLFNCSFDNSIHVFPLEQNLDIYLSNCTFHDKFTIPNYKKVITFSNKCIFKEQVIFVDTSCLLKFENCIFNKEIRAEDIVFENKVRFRGCEFHQDVNFRNTTFKKLVDFWRCTFYQPTTFYKTDFLDIVVFSDAKFKENVLFTYALIDKLMILRGTFPEKGFDLSLAIINGDLNIFNFNFNDFNTYSKIYKDVSVAMEKHLGTDAYVKAYEEVYEDAVSNKHLIPIENKRETYRILKHQLESQKNFIDAIPYKVKESRTHLKESWQQLRNGVHVFNPISNLIVLSLNGISNWFGLSYIQGALFTVLIGGLFFTLTLSHIGNFEFTWDYEQWQWEYFVQFLNPTHRFDYMKAIDENPRTWFFIWDFIGRIFVGYGIYQTIQAFRKYK